MNDLVVVGGGLGGYTAALAAAQDRPDANVTVLKRDNDRFTGHPGPIDLLGYVTGEWWPTVTPLDRVGQLPKTHPYRRLGTATVRDALAMFDDVTDDRYSGTSDTNALLMTATGRVTPTSRYPAGMAKGLASDDRETLLVGIQGVSAFDAYYLADALDEQLPYTVTGESISVDTTGTASAPELALAETFDEDIRVDGLGSTPGPKLESFIETVRSKLDVEQRLGVPAVLGLDNHDEIRELLSERLVVDIFEIPTGRPSLPGLRLERLLEAQLESHGVSVESVQIDEYESRGDKLHRLNCQQDGKTETFGAHEFVLATGGLESGGLRSDRRSVFEPIFDCHVQHPADRTEWSRRSPLDDQPFARFGVTVDETLRPLTERDTPMFSNLRAAGPVLGGHNFAAEKSRSGIAVVTGYAAGTRAINVE